MTAGVDARPGDRQLATVLGRECLLEKFGQLRPDRVRRRIAPDDLVVDDPTGEVLPCPTGRRNLESVLLAVNTASQHLDFGGHTLEIERRSTLQKLRPVDRLSDLRVKRFPERCIDKCLQRVGIFLSDQERAPHLRPGSEGRVEFVDEKRCLALERLRRTPLASRKHPRLAVVWNQDTAFDANILRRGRLTLVPMHAGPGELLHVFAVGTRDKVATLIALEVPLLDLAALERGRRANIDLAIVERLGPRNC